MWSGATPVQRAGLVMAAVPVVALFSFLIAEHAGVGPGIDLHPAWVVVGMGCYGVGNLLALGPDD